MAFSGAYAVAIITNPGSALTDFPLLVDLSDMPSEWWSAVDTSTGAKGRAAKDDGTTELATDWIDFDNGAETGMVRVLWSSTLAASGTLKIRIYPPLAANSTYAANDTYGSDNAYPSTIEGYWPLSGDANDRTVNGLDLTENGGVAYSVAGPAGGSALVISGDDDEYLSVASAPVTAFPLTLMAAVYAVTTISPDDGINPLALSIDKTHIVDFYVASSGATPHIYLRNGGGTGDDTAAAAGLTSTVWGHVGARIASQTVRQAFMDGTGGTASSSGNHTFPSTVDKITIGGEPEFDVWDPANYAHCMLVSADVGADWIAHESLQVLTQASMYSGGWTWTTTGYDITAGQGTYALTGATAALELTRLVAAASGAYALTGRAAGLEAARIFSVEQGAYALTGSAVDLELVRAVLVGQGAYALAGAGLSFLLDNIMAGDQGAYALTGADVTLSTAPVLAAAKGSYALTGHDVDVVASFVVTAAQGSYALTGATIAFTVTSDLVAEQGTYTVTGATAAQLLDAVVSAAKGSYALGGADAGLLYEALISALTGSYALTGSDVTLQLIAALAAAQGSLAITGYDVDLVYSEEESAVVAVTLTGAIDRSADLVGTIDRSFVGDGSR